VFGYDNLSDTYKVVALRLGFLEVKVFSSSDNVWRNIQNFPVFPHYHMKDGVYLNGSVNWFVIRKNLNPFVYDSRVVTVEQFVIVSLDLGTETFTQLLPPRSFDFDGVPSFEPSLCVLMDCLCYCHDFKENYFVIWQMKEFGVQESWTQFLKISYHNLEIYFDFRHLYLLPLCLSGDTLILTNDQDRQAILYNWKDNRVERTKITNRTWWSSVKGYVESLFSYH
jgi:F-box interacting protein